VPSEDINVATDAALCRGCSNSFAFSSVVRADTAPLAPLGPSDIPAHCWYHDDGVETRIGASTRSPLMALGLLVFMLVWNGLMFGFVTAAAAATIYHFGGTPPAWFPQTPIGSGQGFGGSLVFQQLFLTPFILVGLGLPVAIVLTLFGITEARRHQDQLTLFVGVGEIGRTRRVEVSTITRIHLGPSRWQNEGRARLALIIETRNDTLHFGSWLPAARQASCSMHSSGFERRRPDASAPHLRTASCWPVRCGHALGQDLMHPHGGRWFQPGSLKPSRRS